MFENKSRISCSEHPNEEITNYCCNMHCLRPLCPDCVEIHTKSHSKQQIQSWKNCLNNTMKQLKNTHYRLKEIQNKLGYNRGGRTIEAIEEQAIRKLDNLRRQMHQLVDQVFNHHERQIRNIIRNQFRSTPIDLSKLRVAIQQIQKLMMKISNSNTVMPALKKSILLDHSALINHFEQEFRNAPQQVIKDEFYLNVDQQDITKLKRNLERLINYDSTEIVNKQNYGLHLLSLPKESVNQRGLVVGKQDYFYETSSKYLHFFVPLTNHLKLLHLSQLNSRPIIWKTVKLSMTGVIPSFYKSIISPQGQIFLIGGTSGQSNQKITTIARYNPQKTSLQYVTDMITPRSSHAICYMNRNIFIVGGFKMQGQTTNQCQIFNIETRKCRSIGSLCYPSANCCISAFNNEYIFKFGGILSSNQPSHVIEMYSVRENSWITIDPDLQRYTERIWITSFSAAVQINSNQIFIFGGYSDLQNQMSSTMSYTLFVQKRGNENVFSLRNIGTHPLPIAQGFWDNNPIIVANQVITLQNVQDVDQMSADIDQRKILIFNGKRWSIA